MLGKALGNVFLMSHKTSGQVACYENQMIDGEALLMEELHLEGTRVSETALLQL